MIFKQLLQISLIFKVIDNNRDIGNIFSDVFSKTSKEKYDYDDSFKQRIQQDTNALDGYQQKINNGVTNTKKLQKALAGASAEARVFAETGLRAGQSVESFVVNQKQAQIATAAQNKSLGNVRALINTYNSDSLKTELGLEHQQFAEGVTQSNLVLGEYLSKTEAGKATMGGYIRSLVAAKAATLGLKVATTALNMGITMLVSLGISALINSIVQATEAEKKAVEDAAHSLSELQSTLSDLDDYKNKISELREELDKGTLSQSDANQKREELLALQDELIDKYGKEEGAIKNIRAAILGETDAFDQLTDREVDKWLTENKDAINDAEKYATEYLRSSDIFVKIDNPDNYELSRTIRKEAIKQGLAEYVSYNSIGFSGTREEIVEKIQAFREWLRQYAKDNNISSDLRDYFIEQVDDTENYITDNNAEDGNYNTRMSVFHKAAEYETRINHSELYNSLNNYKDEYEKAILSGDNESAEAAYDSFQNTFNDFVEKIKSGNDSITKAEGYFLTNFKKDFQKQAENTDLTIKIKASLDDKDSLANKIRDEINNSKKALTYDDIVQAEKIAELNGIEKFDISQDKEVRESDELSVEQAKTYNDIVEAANAAGVSVDKYIESLLNLGIIQKEISKENISQTFDLSEEQSEELKTIYSDIDKLNEAYQNLCNGDLKDSDVAELVDMFPTLGKYVDWTDEKFGNLAEGIHKVISERPQELIEQLEAIDMSNMSEDEKGAIQSLISYLQTLKTGLKDTKTSIENIQTALSGVSGSIETLIGFKKEIADSGYLSKSSIDTILTDDTYIPIRPYIDDTDGMKSAIDSYISTQKEAYKSLYNDAVYKSDTAAYTKEVKNKEKTNKDYLQDAIKDIENQTSVIEQLYGVDLSNWSKISETKQAILQNTNAELLAKQNSLINDFAKYYNTDLKNYKNIAEAKAAILENFRTSEAFTKARSVLLEDPTKSGVNFDRVEGKRILYAADEVRKEINSILSSSGLTYDDFEQYMINDTFTSKGNKQLEENLSQIVQAYQIDTKQWDNMLADVLSDGDTTVSSDNGNNGDVDESKASEYIDWIERRLKKFAQNTKEVFSKVKDYITFTNQNSQLRKAINSISDEIAANERAYQTYMNEANNIGLSSDWVQWIQNGGYAIQDITNFSDDLKEKVNRYEELYDKAIDCKNAVADLKETEKEYAEQMLSNVEQYYQNRINAANSDVEYYNSLDTDTQFINKNYNGIRNAYNQQITQTEKQARELQSTLNSLVSQGLIKAYSDEWYSWTQKIEDCNVSVRNLRKSIHDLAIEELQNIQTLWDNRIDSIENTISQITTSDDDTTRNKSKNYNGLRDSYNKQISYTKKEISELQARLNKAIKSGDIQKYSNEWYEWIGIIDEGNTKVAELERNIHELSVEKFNDIQTSYENQGKLIEHTSNTYESKNNELEEKGYLASLKYYSALVDNERKNISNLQGELKNLQISLNTAIGSGNVQKGSEEWYEMQDAINSVSEAIDEANIKLIEYSKQMREIQWGYFDFLQDRISQLTQEADFLVDLMSNSKLHEDNGKITSEGKATMGLHTQNYNVYMAQADKYANEISKINRDMAKDPYDTKLIERKEELLKLQQDSILAAEKEKQAIVDLVKEGIDLQLESLKELIDTYEESLDSAKNLYDYQKQINDKTSDISTLQKQLAAYEGDTSEETKAKIQQIQVDLQEAQEDLEQTEYEKAVSDTKELLDNLYDEYEETLNSRLDNVDALICDVTNAVNLNSKEINETIKSVAGDAGYVLSSEIRNIWNGSGAVNGSIVANYSSNFTGQLTSINAVLNAIQDKLTNLIAAGDKTTTNAATTKTPTTATNSNKTGTSTNNPTNKNNTNKNNTNSNTSKSTNTNKNTSNKSSSQNNSASNNIKTGTKINAKGAKIYESSYGGTGLHQYYADEPYYIVLGENNGYYMVRWYKASSGVTGWFKKGDVKKYKTGGLVDYTGLAQLDGTPAKPELVLNSDDTKNFINLRDILREKAQQPLTFANQPINEYYKNMAVNGLTAPQVSLPFDIRKDFINSANPSVNQTINLGGINIEHIEDYNDFVTKLQKDRKFERMIQDMTIGRINGRSSLSKYKYNWD